jgi:hypothetical protein
VQRLIDWSQSDAFWYRNILSPEKFREKFDRLAVESRDVRRKAKASTPDGMPRFTA